MNSLVRASRAIVPRASRSMATSTQGMAVHKGQRTFVQNYLSDAGAYPVIGVVAIACAGCVGYLSYNILYNPDIRYAPSKRQSLVRTWAN
mmetsp:Transcript_27929/g.42971  ORF Transcript_27929/g.42971 Transcript_27929/m.42971 type:complete len:90 (-) Transcript_27929:122-391(-)